MHQKGREPWGYPAPGGPDQAVSSGAGASAVSSNPGSEAVVNSAVPVRVTYRLRSPPISKDRPGQASVEPFKNGRESFTPYTNIPTLTVVALR